MTDATVAGLAVEPRLAVIGNAAVLRTARPFRDVAAVRDALGARFIVIGQVQSRDGGVAGADAPDSRLGSGASVDRRVSRAARRAKPTSRPASRPASAAP